MWYVPGICMTKCKSPEMKMENESIKFLEGDPHVDVMIEAGREKESVCINKISSSFLSLG